MTGAPGLPGHEPSPLTDAERTAIANHGWTPAWTNNWYETFTRDGYWLRLSILLPRTDRDKLDGRSATIQPISHGHGHGTAPTFVGRGARKRALEYAQALYSAERSWMADVGIVLRGMAVLQNMPSGGSGSRVSEYHYRLFELRGETPPWLAGSQKIVA